MYKGVVAFVLVPEGLDELSAAPAALSFALGTLVILTLDREIEEAGTNFGQALAMVTDFVPEAIALGALFGRGT